MIKINYWLLSICQNELGTHATGAFSQHNEISQFNVRRMIAAFVQSQCIATAPVGLHQTNVLAMRHWPKLYCWRNLPRLIVSMSMSHCGKAKGHWMEIFLNGFATHPESIRCIRTLGDCVLSKWIRTDRKSTSVTRFTQSARAARWRTLSMPVYVKANGNLLSSGTAPVTSIFMQKFTADWIII